MSDLSMQEIVERDDLWADVYIDPLDDRLHDAALELRENECSELARAVEEAREALRTKVDPRVEQEIFPIQHLHEELRRRRLNKWIPIEQWNIDDETTVLFKTPPHAHGIMSGFAMGGDFYSEASWVIEPTHFMELPPELEGGDQ